MLRAGCFRTPNSPATCEIPMHLGALKANELLDNANQVEGVILASNRRIKVLQLISNYDQLKKVYYKNTRSPRLIPSDCLQVVSSHFALVPQPRTIFDQDKRNWSKSHSNESQDRGTPSYAQTFVNICSKKWKRCPHKTATEIVSGEYCCCLCRICQNQVIQ